MKTVTDLPIKESFERAERRSFKALKRLTKRSYYGLHIITLVALGVFIYATSHTNGAITQAIVPRTIDADAPAAIDAIASTDIAAAVANASNLTEKDSVANQADSLTAQVTFATVSDSYLAKPQIVVTDTKTKKDIITYKTVAGDKVSALAARFNITSDTIKWANNLTGDTLPADKDLTIPPINGVFYEVKAGDTVDTLAAKYHASKEQIIFFNDIELTGLKPGDKIMIPGGSIQAAVARATTATQSFSFSFPFGTSAQYGGNGYSYGYCTWYVSNRRAAAGHPVPSNLGNASTWYALSQAAGLGVGSSPAVGAVMWTRGGNHVAYVEGINPDGSLSISEMNAPIWGRRTDRVVPVSEISRYGFIY